MNGLGGLNKSPNGVVIGLVQLQLPVVATKADLARQTERIVWMVGKARRNLGTMDLVVFPEYSLHGLSMDINPEIMCSLDGPDDELRRPDEVGTGDDVVRALGVHQHLHAGDAFADVVDSVGGEPAVDRAVALPQDDPRCFELRGGEPAAGEQRVPDHAVVE